MTNTPTSDSIMTYSLVDLLRFRYCWRIRCYRFIRSQRADLQRSDAERRLSTLEAWQP
jgi:hypothetical protein